MDLLAVKVVEILSVYPICDSCLGRQFSLLGTQTTNGQRGYSLKLYLTMQMHAEALEGSEEAKTHSLEVLKKLAKNGNHVPAGETLRKLDPAFASQQTRANEPEFRCYLCDKIFAQVKEIAELAYNKAKEFEFQNFLVGTVLLPEISDREDEFRARFQLTQGEAFKSHLNREVGKVLQKRFDVPVEFKDPQFLFQVELGYAKREVTGQANPLYIAGRYKKYERGIPQTHWPCTHCGGKGCEHCGNQGKMYPTSVEELVSKEILEAAQGTETKFHGAGREDIDARCLGTGRPYVIEVKNPKKRTFDLQPIETLINVNTKGRVEVHDLAFSSKDYVQKIKTEAEYHTKKYVALCSMEPGVSPDQFAQKLRETQEKIAVIEQRTPTRVAHRRADLTREKRILKIEGKWLDEVTAEFQIEAQGGAYIKELISGDDGRTRPNISEIFGVRVTCKELDVVHVEEAARPPKATKA